MWLWQLKLRQWHAQLPKYYQEMSKIVGATTAGHLVCLFLLFVVYRGYMQNCALTVSKSAQALDAKIVIVPWHKKSSHTVALLPSLPPAPQPKQIVHEESVVAPEVSRPSLATHIDTAGTVVATVKEPAAKSKKKQKEKKQNQGKSAKAQKKKNSKKQAPPKQAKKEQKVIEKKQKPVVKEVQQQTPIAAAPVVTQEQVATAVDAQSTLYLTQDEFDAVNMQQQIQEQIQTHWQPPVGLPRDIACLISVLVDAQGKPHSINVAKSSGVLVYDVSACEAINQMEFPKMAFGKEMTITFNQ